MPLRRVHDTSPCHSEHHYFTGDVRLSPGAYEWECPKCGHRTKFSIFDIYPALAVATPSAALDLQPDVWVTPTL